MRNITGSPVENKDYFDRPREISRLFREIDNLSNVLLTAPRRIGKTSLVLRFCEALRANGTTAVFLNVEGCHDELSFVEKILEHFEKEERLKRLTTLWSRAVKAIRRTTAGSKLGICGLDVVLPAADDVGSPTHLRHAVESILSKIEEDASPVVIAIDELPESLLGIQRQEGGRDRLERFLHWLRELRQQYRRNVRWIFLGSIGLDTFVDDRRLRKTINDLTPINVDGLSDEEAHDFLDRLGRSNQLPLDEPARRAILAKIGWPIPHHLQLFFHELKDCGCAVVGEKEADAAFERMLEPARVAQFDTWRQRLDDQFTPTDASAAKAILRFLTTAKNGATRGQLFRSLVKDRAAADPSDIEAQISKLLVILERDGYLLRHEDRFAFRSFLLREVWKRMDHR